MPDTPEITQPKTLTPKQKKCNDCPPLVVPRRGYTPTRPSCIECVEKHLGAALVLLTEAREGYAYRLRAIGHLFEAEDESQEWPQLHAAIREARKAYQADGTLPDWEALATRAHDQRVALAAGPSAGPVTPS
jgi:hypothetical protein